MLGFLGRSRRHFADRDCSQSPETIVNREDRRSNRVRKFSTFARGIFFDPRAIPLESISLVGNVIVD